MNRRNQIPPILKDIIEESKRPLSRREIEAGEALILGRGSLRELLEAKHAARKANVAPPV